MLVGLALVAHTAWLQLASLSLPIHVYEGHHWRQSFTFGVAWNFAHTTLDVLRPRMFTELQRSNVVAMEAPLYPLVASVLLRVGRDSVVGPRLVSWLSLVASAVVLFRMLGVDRADRRDAWADRAGLLVSLSLPAMIAVDFRSVQPEPVAAGLSMIAAGYFARYSGSDRRRDALLGAVFTTLAVLTKPSVLGVVPGLALFAVWGPGRWLRRALVVAGGLSSGLVLYAAWDRWAARLLRTEMNGVVVISIQHDATEMLRNLRNVAFAREALLHFIPNYAGSWWLTPALVAGIYRSLSDSRLRRFGVPFAVWLAGFTVELLAFGDRLHSNAYYFILAPAPVAFFCAVGLGGLVRALESATRRPPITAYRVALALALLLPLGLATARASTWSSVEPADFGFERNRAVWTDDLGLLRILMALVVAIALAPRLRPRRIPRWIGVPAILAVLSTGWWALRDRDQYFRFYTAITKRRGFTEELSALRAAVARYSSVDDRVVVNADEMTFFYYALRNGFPVAQVQSPAQLAAARARGARLYLHLDPLAAGETPPQMQGTLLERGRYWRMYCIDERGCPERTGKLR